MAFEPNNQAGSGLESVSGERSRTPSSKPTNQQLQKRIDQRATDWIEMVRAGGAKAPALSFYRGLQLYVDITDRPELAYQVIFEITRRFVLRDLICPENTEAQFVLGQLGAGPLEMLLAQRGEQFINRIEIEAGRDQRARWMLRFVWQNVMPDELWGHVQRARETSQDRAGTS